MPPVFMGRIEVSFQWPLGVRDTNRERSTGFQDAERLAKEVLRLRWVSWLSKVSKVFKNVF